jgi:phosphate transport system permease protein
MADTKSNSGAGMIPENSDPLMNIIPAINIPPISLRRRFTDHAMTGIAVLTVILVLLPLFAIFTYLIYKGIGSINLAFLTQTPKPVGEPGGGMANAIVGSMLILGIASAIGVPFGIGAGIFLSEYGRNRYGDSVRFVSDVLNGVPSIVVGIVAYGLVVMRQKHFSALAGGVALAIMMVPTIARTTEQMLLLVPQAIREAAYGLGVSRWRTTLSITLRTATSGVITGVMLAFARVAGETAPLLFTAFGNQFWNWKTDQPTAALSLQIFTYAISPFDEWHRQAWAGALVLIILIVGAVAAVRIAVRHGTLAGA